MSRRWIQLTVLWVLFFMIGCGLGFPTLARYDLRETVGTTDARTYLAMVEDGPPYPAGEDSNRVLVPALAKPVYWLARDRVGSWDEAALGLLVANAAMVATTGLLLFTLGRAVTGSAVTGLIAALLLIVNFTTVNAYLSGYVDAAEMCLLMAVVCALWFKRYWLLPLVAVVGAAAKETLVLFSLMVAGGWVAALEGRSAKRTPALWTAAMAVAGLVYTFAWLVPLGAWRLRRLPRPWLAGVAVAAAAGLCISAFDDSRGNTARVLFLVVGPPLCLSAAALLATALESQVSARPTGSVR